MNAWTIASLPLWIMGGGAMVLGIYGIWLARKKRAADYFWGGVFFLMIAAILLPIAARVAS